MSDTNIGNSKSNNGSNKKGTPINKDSGNGNLTNEVNLSLKKEMETSYLSYAMSVIVSRALPDARDGLNLFIEEFFMQWINLDTIIIDNIINIILMVIALYMNQW